MRSEKATHTIQELIDEGIITAHKDGNYGSMYPRQSEFGDTGVLFLTAKLVSDQGFIDFENAPRLNNEKAEKLPFGYIESKDVLLSHNATVGRVALTPELTEPVLVGTSLTYFRTNSERLLPEYFAAYLSGVEFQNELKAVMGLSTRNQVPITTQRKLEVVIPPLPEQKAIAHILGSLDDKIELNRRMNATLEGMAQALFKSWFVDFDPVIDNALAAGNPIPEEFKALAETRRTALANNTANRETAKAFPSSFQQTESMGWIPEGWEYQALYDLAKFINGASYKGSDFSDSPEALPVIKIAEVKGGISTQTKFTEINKGDKYRINDGDILLSWSGNPDTSIDTFIWTDGPGYLNQHVFNVCLHQESDRYFVYYQLKYLRSTFAEIARDKQTTGLGHFTAGDMKRLKVFKPATTLLEQFNTAVSSLYLRGYDNRLATKTLTKLRDTLLPKLISGELRIPEAEKQTGIVIV